MSIPIAAAITMFLVAVIPLAPTEPVLAAMGVLAATEHVAPLGAIVIAAVGCSLSDHLLYAVGRFTGGPALARLRRKRSIDAATQWLIRNSARWGVPILIVGRWLPAGGTVGALLAGTLRWPLSRFTPTSLIGSTLWSTYVALIGYLGGSIISQPVFGLLFSLGLATLFGLTASVLLQRAHRRRPVIDTVAGVDIGDPAEVVQAADSVQSDTTDPVLTTGAIGS
jgi:membrane protein DedA with SNARE-associated domain